MKRSFSSALTKVLTYLAQTKEDRERTKYRIEKSTKLHKQTVYNGIDRLKMMRLVKEIELGRSRVGLPVKAYRLTEQGWFSVSFKDPKLVDVAKKQLGVRYDELQQKYRKATQEWADFLVETIRELLTARKVRPGYFFNLTIKADETGRVSYKVQYPFP